MRPPNKLSKMFLTPVVQHRKLDIVTAVNYPTSWYFGKKCLE